MVSYLDLYVSVNDRKCCVVSSQHSVKHTSSASHIFFANVCIRFLSICRMCILITFSCGIIYCIYTTLLQLDYVPISHMPISNKYYRTFKIFGHFLHKIWLIMGPVFIHYMFAQLYEFNRKNAAIFYDYNLSYKCKHYFICRDVIHNISPSHDCIQNEH